VLLIEAILGADKDQVTSFVRSREMPPGNKPVAANCSVAPTAMVGLAGLTEIDETLEVVPVPVRLAA
jgi:hypothetical protein